MFFSYFHIYPVKINKNTHTTKFLYLFYVSFFYKAIFTSTYAITSLIFFQIKMALSIIAKIPGKKRKAKNLGDIKDAPETFRYALDDNTM